MTTLLPAAMQPHPLALIDRSEFSARTGFATSLCDRAAELRDDEDALAALMEDNTARFAVMAGDRPVLRQHEQRLTVWHDATALAGFGRATGIVFLGRDGAAGRFAVRVTPEAAEARKDDDGLVIIDLRSLAIQGLVPAAELGAVGEAKAMTDWHHRNGYCPACAGRTRSGAGGWKRVCEACNAQHFPRTDPVTIMLITHGDRCLLARQARFPPGMYSCIAGFVEPGETIEDAVRRETLEEAGLVVGRVRYLASQSWPFPSSLMIGCVGEALGDVITLDGTELEAGRWFSRSEAQIMLDGQHPDGLTAPIPVAIANTLLCAWLAGEKP